MRPIRPAVIFPRISGEPHPGTSLSDDIWVHYGFTGTGMWISPRRRRWAVLLTNKLYYTRDRQPLADVRNAFRGMAFR